MCIKKFALIHMGSDIVYSLEYVATEIARSGHEFRWFDGDVADIEVRIAEYAADFICFSPLTTFFRRAVELSRKVKKIFPSVRSVFGGHHVSAVPEVIKMPEIDTVVVGPVYGTIEKIVESKLSEVLIGQPVLPGQMWPSAREYFVSIPHMGSRHRKAIMSHFGCEYNCSYCNTSRVRKSFGTCNYRKYWLTRRPIEDLIKEAKLFLEFPTKEVTMGDDDILYGKDIEEWLSVFTHAWKKEIDLPIYGFVTPPTVTRVSDKTMEVLASLVDTVALGVQAARPESLKLFNRQFQKEEQVKRAFDRLHTFGIPAKVEVIIGLPVADPVQDAIESILFAQRVGGGDFWRGFSSDVVSRNGSLQMV